MAGNKTSAFKVNNTGTGDLIVRGVNLLGLNPTDFIIDPATIFPFTIKAGAASFINIINKSITLGLKKATVQLLNNDNDEGIYEFAIQANVTSPEINVIGNYTPVIDGSYAPSLGNGTDFGYVTVGDSFIRTFDIGNIENAN